MLLFEMWIILSGGMRINCLRKNCEFFESVCKVEYKLFPNISDTFTERGILIQHTVPQTVCLTLGVLTVRVKGRGARSGCRTEFVAIFVLSCLHVRFVCEFSYFRAGRGRRRRVLYVNFRSFRLFNFFDVHFSW